MEQYFFDEFALRDALNRKHISTREFAKALSIATPTLYRKMSGDSDFTRTEIQKSCEILGHDTLHAVFFARKVAETQRSDIAS